MGSHQNWNRVVPLSVRRVTRPERGLGEGCVGRPLLSSHNLMGGGCRCQEYKTRMVALRNQHLDRDRLRRESVEG